MTNAHEQTPADALAAIIAAGQAAFEATLPAYARRSGVETDALDVVINLTLSEERQAAICLNCHLSDCVGIEKPACPIRIEQRRIWREQRQRKVSQ